MFTDHSALKYLINKPVLRGNICIWLLLFEECDFQIIVKLGRLIVGPNHMLILETREEPTSIDDNLPDVQRFAIRVADDHFVDTIHFLTIGMAPSEYST